MGWFGLGGNTVKDVGTAVKESADGLVNLATSIRAAITGDMPPATVEKLAEIEKQILELEAKLRSGQQQIELAAINKGGFGAFLLAGWRPALGWVAVFAMFSYYVPPIIAQTIFWVMGMAQGGEFVAWPATFDMADIIGLVGTLIGMGTLRTIEKNQGTVNTH
jgi:hypothetical protein